MPVEKEYAEPVAREPRERPRIELRRTPLADDDVPTPMTPLTRAHKLLIVGVVLALLAVLVWAAWAATREPDPDHECSRHFEKGVGPVGCMP